MSALIDQLKQMPKIELHAHLSGSVRYAILLDLARQQSDESQMSKDISLLSELTSQIHDSKNPELSKCFKVFEVLHRLIRSAEILRHVTRHVLQDFQADNCVYLELRTTPRDIQNDKGQIVVTKLEYLDVILTCIEELENSPNNSMLTRLVLSVDRAKPIEEGLATIEMCHELRATPKGSRIVGVDFSGNPMRASLREAFRPCLELVRKYQIPVTVHIGEIWQDEADLDFIINDYRPDRIGHAVCLTSSDISCLLERPIPIEICPTSNIITGIVAEMVEHPFGEINAKSECYPMSICTDDCGLFDTSLTRENLKIAQAFNKDVKEMFDLTKRSVEMILDKSLNVRNFIKDKFDEFEKKLYSKM